MKVSQITANDLAAYLKEDFNAMTSAEQSELVMMLVAAKAFVLSHTGLTAEAIDTHEDITIVVYVLVEDMYENRTFYVEKNNLNKVVDIILGMHSVNLL